MTPRGSLDLLRTQPESRAERLGVALRGLATELIDERRKVAELRRENVQLRSQLASLTSTQPRTVLHEAEPVAGGSAVSQNGHGG